MVAAAKLLKPKDLEVGALVQARDPQGLWYNAKVIGKSGRGASQAVLVHYIRFSKRWDEKFTARQEGLYLNSLGSAPAWLGSARAQCLLRVRTACAGRTLLSRWMAHRCVPRHPVSLCHSATPTGLGRSRW